MLSQDLQGYSNVPQVSNLRGVSSSVSRPLSEEVWGSTSSVTYHLQGYSETRYIIYDNETQVYVILGIRLFIIKSVELKLHIKIGKIYNLYSRQNIKNKTCIYSRVSYYSGDLIFLYFYLLMSRKRETFVNCFV